MPSLVIHSEVPHQAAAFSRRVLIGRKAFNGVQFGQRIVSRIHAWIDRDEQGFYIRDARSRGGTFVNSKRTDGKVRLNDGDEIKIGTSKMSFHASDELPADAVVFRISDNGTNPEFVDPGILISCESCAAPMWVPKTMAGAFGRCAICTGAIVVPGEPASGIRRPLTPNDSIVDMPAISELGDTARPVDQLAVEHLPEPHPNEAEHTCGICQSAIIPGEVTRRCSSCSQIYHAECWNENRGCAAYGCQEVGALDHDLPIPAMPVAARSTLPAEPEAFTAPTLSTPQEIAESQSAESPEAPLQPAPEHRGFPWDFLLLGGSVFGTIIGAFSFGLPALIVGIASAIYAMRRRNGKYGLAALSAVICLIGVACGVITSSLIFNVPLPRWGSR